MANYFVRTMTCILASFVVVFARKEPSNVPSTLPPVASLNPLATPSAVIPLPPIVMPPIVIPAPPPSPPTSPTSPTSPIVIPVPPTPPIVVPTPPTSQSPSSPPDDSTNDSPTPSPSEEGEGPSPPGGPTSGVNRMSSSFNFVQFIYLVFASIPFVVLA